MNLRGVERMKTIKQLSAELGISKEAIYKKLKYQLNEELNGHAVKLDGVTHIDEEGECIIRQSMSHERREAIQGILDVNDAVDKPHVSEYINLLENQLKTKDLQIETQNSHIGLLIRQLGSSHMLAQAERVRGLLTNKTSVEPEKRTRLKISLWRRIFG